MGIVVSWLLPTPLIYPFFSLLLAFAGGVYVGFAIVDPNNDESLIQWGSQLTFVGIALAALYWSPLIIALGWVLHAAWDLLHHWKFLKTETQKWYPPFCMIYDLIIAGYLVYKASITFAG